MRNVIGVNVQVVARRGKGQRIHANVQEGRENVGVNGAPEENWMEKKIDWVVVKKRESWIVVRNYCLVGRED